MVTPLMLGREEREPLVPVLVILLGSPLFPWWWRLSEAGAVKQWRLLKGRYREIFPNFFFHILVDIGPQKSILKVYIPKLFFLRDMGS